LAFGCWRFFAVLGFVLGGEFGFEFRVADEALRFGSAVFFTPVTFILEGFGNLRIAHAAIGFFYAVFVAPPFAVSVRNDCVCARSRSGS